MRIPTLLEKISQLAAKPEASTALDLDLMLDYTRVLYADLLEWRARIVAQPPLHPAAPEPPRAQAIVPESASVPVPQEPQAPQQMAAPQAELLTAGWSGGHPKSERDIRSQIGINDKYLFLSELFGNDKEAYEEALDYINSSPGESEAQHWLRERLWIAEERSDAAQIFFELVSRHFES